MGAARLRLVRDADSGIEAIRAHFTGHAYDLHHHDEWLIGVTESGVQDFLCRGRRRRSTRGKVILIEPQEPHDGEAGAPEGFAYHMLYLPQPWLADGLAQAGCRPGAGFRHSLIDAPALGRAVGRACAMLSAGEPRLLRDAALDGVLGQLAPHLGDVPARAGSPGPDDAVAARARDCLADLMAADIGADALAAAAGAANRFQLARAFRARYGTSPHAYLVQTRLTAARRLLARGMRPAEAAAEAGFADQSHLGRWFRRAYGMTPSDYRRTARAF